MNAHKFPAGRPTGTPAAASAQTHGAPCSAVSLSAVEAGGQALITAPASKVPPATFLRMVEAMFGVRPCRESEREAAAKAYIGKVLCGGDADEAKAERDARFEEIEERYLHREVMVNAGVKL
jgi:hypothetical protein